MAGEIRLAQRLRGVVGAGERHGRPRQLQRCSRVRRVVPEPVAVVVCRGEIGVRARSLHVDVAFGVDRGDGSTQLTQRVLQDRRVPFTYVQAAEGASQIDAELRAFPTRRLEERRCEPVGLDRGHKRVDVGVGVIQVQQNVARFGRSDSNPPDGRGVAARCEQLDRCLLQVLFVRARRMATAQQPPEMEVRDPFAFLVQGHSGDRERPAQQRLCLLQVPVVDPHAAKVEQSDGLLGVER